MAVKDLNQIPLESLTTGQAQMYMKSLLAYKTAMVERKKGNTSSYRTWMERSNTLDQLTPSLHNENALQSISSAMDSYVAEAVSVSKDKRDFALRKISQPVYTVSDTGLASLNNPTLPFDPTPEQIQECINRGNQIYGSSSSRSKTLWIQSCIDRLPYKNIIHQHVGQSGAVLLYPTLKKSNSSFNQTITSKDSLQAGWINGASRATGISQTYILDMLKVNVIDTFGNTPDNIEQGLQPYMSPIGSPGAMNITPQTKTPDIIFPTGGGSVPTTKEEAILNMIIQIVNVIIGLFQLFKKRNEEAKRRETAFADTPTIEDDFIMKCWDFNGVDISCSSSEAVVKRCFDEVTGEEIVCPEEDDKGSNNTLLYVGGGILVLGLIFGSRGNRKNSNDER